jgi:hypothetical protein
MRQVMSIFVLAVLLLGPLREWTHHHAPGSHDSGCVACQVHHVKAEPPACPRCLEAPPPATVAVERSGPALEVGADPLRVAPKTSPPRPRSRS